MKQFEGKRFSLKAYKRATAIKRCICNFRDTKGQAVRPFNRSCPYHGEKTDD